MRQHNTRGRSSRPIQLGGLLARLETCSEQNLERHNVTPQFGWSCSTRNILIVTLHERRSLHSSRVQFNLLMAFFRKSSQKLSLCRHDAEKSESGRQAVVALTACSTTLLPRSLRQPETLTRSPKCGVPPSLGLLGVTVRYCEEVSAKHEHQVLDAHGQNS
jgi:hypothetical protein